MTNLGLGVMIQMLGGNEESVETLQKALNKKIVALSLGNDDALHFEMEDGFKMCIADKGQSCCEYRYMRTDANLEYFVGSVFLNIEIREAAPLTGENDYGDHEIQFLDITTDKGVFTMDSHNEHNGYYGGFWIVASSE